MLSLVLTALGCEPSVLHHLDGSPVPLLGAVEVSGGKVVTAGTVLAGAKVVLHSPVSEVAFRSVLGHPEGQEEWMPGRMGIALVKELGPNLLYNRIDLVLQRQTISRLQHVEHGRCWTLQDPNLWQTEIAPWATDAPFESVGFGQWTVEPVADGAVVTYQVWLPPGNLPAWVQRWALQTMLPDLVRAFEARAAGRE